MMYKNIEKEQIQVVFSNVKKQNKKNQKKKHLFFLQLNSARICLTPVLTGHLAFTKRISYKICLTDID